MSRMPSLWYLDPYWLHNWEKVCVYRRPGICGGLAQISAYHSICWFFVWKAFVFHTLLWRYLGQNLNMSYMDALSSLPYNPTLSPQHCLSQLLASFLHDNDQNPLSFHLFTCSLSVIFSPTRCKLREDKGKVLFHSAIYY